MVDLQVLGFCTLVVAVTNGYEDEYYSSPSSFYNPSKYLAEASYPAASSYNSKKTEEPAGYQASSSENIGDFVRNRCNRQNFIELKQFRCRTSRRRNLILIVMRPVLMVIRRIRSTRWGMVMLLRVSISLWIRMGRFVSCAIRRIHGMGSMRWFPGSWALDTRRKSCTNTMNRTKHRSQNERLLQCNSVLMYLVNTKEGEVFNIFIDKYCFLCEANNCLSKFLTSRSCKLFFNNILQFTLIRLFVSNLFFLKKNLIRKCTQMLTEQRYYIKVKSIKWAQWYEKHLSLTLNTAAQASTHQLSSEHSNRIIRNK